MNTTDQTLSFKKPILVYVALITLTILTVLLSGLGLGNAGEVIIAMAIASLKAAFVLYFFMHLNHEPLIFKLFLGVAFFTLLVIFVLTFSDYTFRGIA